MDDEMKRFLQEELKKDANRVMKAVENDPGVAEMEATPEMHEKLFEQIRQYDQKNEKDKIYNDLPPEYQQLVDLGRVYKRKRKKEKYYVLAAVLVMTCAVGITSIGGAERLFTEIQWMMGGREQVNVDSDSERVEPMGTVKEEEVYQEIQNEFGFVPVRMWYLPQQIGFVKATVDRDARMAQVIYGGEDKESIIYRMNVNYKHGSVGFDVEDKLVKKETVYHNEIPIEVRQYDVEMPDYERWIVKYEYKGVQYFITISDLKEDEIERILKNLKFF